MKNDPRRFAPLGLYLSLIAALAAIGLYVVTRQFNLPVQIALGLIVVGLALFAILDPQRVRSALTGRQARYGSNALILSIAFIGILVVINLLGNTYSRRWDLTEDKTNTLAPETIQALQSLPQPVTATAFYTTRVNSDTARTLLDNFKLNSGGTFDYRFIDPEADPLTAQAAKVTRDGTIVLSMGDRQEQVSLITEQEMTTAMLRLVNPGERVVYFLTGHGERDIAATDEQGLSTYKTFLESKNYQVETLNLLVDRAIPTNAKAIVIAGPMQPVSAEEVTLLKTYIGGGGSLLVMEEPTMLTDFGTQADPLAEYLQSDWGITLGSDLVIDLTANPQTISVAGSYGNHPIVSKLSGMVTVFPTARSVQISQVNSVSQVLLVNTGSQSWAETSLDQLNSQQVVADEGQDLIGSVPLAVAAENLTTNGRVVVVGDSDFAANSAFTSYGNPDFAVNALDWTARQDQLINITPRQTTTRVVAPPTAVSTGLILLVTVIVLPGLMIFGGIMTWVQRRRHG